MKKGRHYSQEEIELIAKSAIGRTFNEIKNYELISCEDGKVTKGGFGQLIEKYLFGIDNNNDSAPDFLDAGIELKVTPYKINKNKSVVAKERLVLNIIDYETEYANDFKASHFWFKNNKLEIIWYLWEPNKTDYKITNEKFLDLSLSSDLKQIEEDYYTIINKIKNGKANEISEADTMYLGACPKGANSHSLRRQPFSNVMAKQRAFCFKSSYMNMLVRKYIGNYKDVEKILNQNTTFKQYIENVINKYKGKSITELKKEFNIHTTAKSANNIIIRNMFNVKGNLSKTEEFLKANIIPRTIRIEENGKIQQSLPFPAFKFTDIVNQTWDNSTLKNNLENTKYMFFIFTHEKNDYIFKGINLWNMPELTLESDVKKVWEETKDIILNGNIIKKINSDGSKETNFPGIANNKICHVRPHARNNKDTYILPVSDKLTGLKEYEKQCFWLNSTYLEEILKDFI